MDWRDRNKQELILSGAGLAALLAILGIAFQAWLSPAMLIQFAGILLCM